MTKPEIKAISKLELKPGDTLVVFVPKHRIAAISKNIADANARLFPGVRTIIAEIGMDMKVIRRKAAKDP